MSGTGCGEGPPTPWLSKLEKKWKREQNKLPVIFSLIVAIFCWMFVVFLAVGEVSGAVSTKQPAPIGTTPPREVIYNDEWEKSELTKLHREAEEQHKVHVAEMEQKDRDWDRCEKKHGKVVMGWREPNDSHLGPKVVCIDPKVVW